MQNFEVTCTFENLTMSQPPLLPSSGFNESQFQQYLMRVEEEEQKTARKGDTDKTVEESVAQNIKFEVQQQQTPSIRIQLVTPQVAQVQRRHANKSAGGFTAVHRRVQEVKHQISKSFDYKAGIKGGKSRTNFIGQC